MTHTIETFESDNFHSYQITSYYHGRKYASLTSGAIYTTAETALFQGLDVAKQMGATPATLTIKGPTVTNDEHEGE